MSLFKRGRIWWYEFWFAGRRLQESAKTGSKTIAKQAEQKRRRELEEGFNRIEDHRNAGIRTIRDVGKDYLEAYALRNRSATFAEYAVGHVTRLLGTKMLLDAPRSFKSLAAPGRTIRFTPDTPPKPNCFLNNSGDLLQKKELDLDRVVPVRLGELALLHLADVEQNQARSWHLKQRTIQAIIDRLSRRR